MAASQGLSVIGFSNPFSLLNIFSWTYNVKLFNNNGHLQANAPKLAFIGAETYLTKVFQNAGFHKAYAGII